jgi:WD40 repeat protein
MNSGRIIATFDVPDAVQHIAWTRDGGAVAAACGTGGAIISFDIADATRGVFKGSVGGPEALAVSPSGRFLFAANMWNGRNTVLDVVTGAAELHFHDTEMAAGVGARPEPAWLRAAAENVHRVIPLLPEDGNGSAGECAIHPAGRMLVTPTARGIVLNDLATGRRLGFLLTAGICWHPRFDTAGNLFVVAAYRAVRWPATAEGNHIRFGPAEHLNLPSGETLDISSDGRFVAQAARNGSAVLDRQTRKITILRPQDDTRHVAINPDGSLIASFGWSTGGLRVWNTESGKLLEVVGTEPWGFGRFTPDGKHLITASRGPQVQLWSMPDCKLVRDLGPVGGFGISPDGRCVAVAEANGKVRITRISDGALIARFDAPGEEYIDSVTFGPDGRYLVGMNADRTRQHVWDLWQLRRRLAEMKLDWETNPAPEPVEPRDAISVEIAAQK